MNQVESTYSGQVVCISISTASSSAMASWPATYGVQFSIARDSGGATHSAYGVSGTPHNVIVDKVGNIAWERAGLTDFNTFKAQIDPLLN
jgi:peroxiredoxin